MPRTLESQITLEKTPSYFVTQEAPRRIFNMSRDTKLIVVVRNPVTRAISDYTQTLSKKPDIPTFEGLSFRNRTLGLVDVSWNAIRAAPGELAALLSVGSDPLRQRRAAHHRPGRRDGACPGLPGH